MARGLRWARPLFNILSQIISRQYETKKKLTTFGFYLNHDNAFACGISFQDGLSAYITAEPLEEPMVILALAR